MTSNGIVNHISDLISWKNPLLTYSFLLGFNCMYAIIFIFKYSLISLFGWASFAFLLICSPLAFSPSSYPPSLENQIDGSNKSNTSKTSSSTTADNTPNTEISSNSFPQLEIISSTTLYNFLIVANEFINSFASHVRYILLWKNPTHSLAILITLAFFAHTSSLLKITIPMAIYFIVHTYLLISFMKTYHKKTIHLIITETLVLIEKIPKIDSQSDFDLHNKRKTK